MSILVFNMKYLLDTHVVLWTLSNSPKLPQEIRELIIEERNEIYVSIVSLWEIAIKHKTHPDIMPWSAEEIRNFSQRSGFIFLSLSLDNVVAYEKLDFKSNNDPFDRMLVSQSESNNIRLITHDQKIREIGVGNLVYF